MNLLCINRKCDYNIDCECQNVYLYVECFRLSQECAKNIINEHLNSI